MEEKKPVDPKKLTKVLDTALLYGLIAAAIGAVLRLQHLHWNKQFLIVGLGTIINVVMIRAFYTKTLDAYITGVAIALACLAILFKLNHFQGADTLIYLAVASAIVYALNMAKNVFFPVKEREEK